MNISAASSANDLWKLLQSSQTAAGSAISPTTNTSGSSSVASSSRDGSSLSSAAKLFSTLQNLSQSNPAEFKKISSQLASQLQQAAKDAKDPGQADALNQLATNFQNAAKSGNFSDLFSQSGSVASTSHIGGHHHHYHVGADSDDNSSSSSSSSASQSTSDPLSAIFSDALTQISKDLQSSTSSTPVTL